MPSAFTAALATARATNANQLPRSLADAKTRLSAVLDDVRDTLNRGRLLPAVPGGSG